MSSTSATLLWCILVSLTILLMPCGIVLMSLGASKLKIAINAFDGLAIGVRSSDVFARGPTYMANNGRLFCTLTYTFRPSALPSAASVQPITTSIVDECPPDYREDPLTATCDVHYKSANPRDNFIGTNRPSHDAAADIAKIILGLGVGLIGVSIMLMLGMCAFGCPCIRKSPSTVDVV